MKIEKLIPGKQADFDPVVGIDIGSRAAKGVLLYRDEIYTQTLTTGMIMQDSADKLLKNLLDQAGLERKDLKYIIGTGYGRVAFSFPDIPGNIISEISAHAMGVHYMNPKAKTIIDIGGQDSKAIRVNPNTGRVDSFIMNDKCAAGTGRFLEKVANILCLEVDDIGELSLKSEKDLSVSSRCVVFAESEVISLRAKNEKIEDIIAGVHLAAAQRVYTLLKRVTIEPDIVFSGGVSRNIGMRAAFERLIGTKIEIPVFDMNYGGALGAAVYAQEYANGHIDAEKDTSNADEVDLNPIRNAVQERTRELIEDKDTFKKVGHVCSYVPMELLNASGVRHARFMHAGTQDEVAAGERFTSATNCDVTKSLVGLFETGDPLMRSFDRLVLFQTCDPMKKTVDLVNERYIPSKMYLLPRNRTAENSRIFFRNEVEEFRRDLEELTGHSIDEEEIRKQIHLGNEVKALLRKISGLRKRNYPALKGKDFLEIMKSYYYLPPKQQIELYTKLYEELEAQEEKKDTPVRIMITGGIVAEGDSKVLDIIEDEFNARVVIDDFCTGYNPIHLDTKEDGDVIQNIAEAYLDSAPCARMVPLEDRLQYSLSLAEEYRVDAVIYKYMKFCQCYGMTRNAYVQAFQEKGIPLLEISGDYSFGDIGQIRTRLEAFLEVVKEKKLGVKK